MRSKLTTIILIGMVLGILVGYACHTVWPDPKTAKSIADYISLITDVFLRLIKMIIAPLVFRVACAAMGDKAKALVEGIEQLSHAILKITGYIMGLAPLAVFASMAAIVTTQGLGILVTYGKFVIEFYFGLAVLWGILTLVGVAVFGAHALRLIGLVKEPFLLAFSTASSEAAYPKTMEQLEKFPI